MMNIPASIEALIKRDTTRKNFRVQFPDSSRADLTNADVVQESVRFTESICSRESFRFGLAEVASIEFETVGVADMRGELIRCSCEIDTSNLTAAQLAEISGGSYDGELVLAADSDLGFGFYRIPCGVFVVDSCPRDHEAQAHRRVTAYSAGYDFELTQYEYLKLALPIPAAGYTYRPYIEALALSAMATDGDEPILAAGWTRSTMTLTQLTSTGDMSTGWIELKNTAGQTLRLWFSDSTIAQPGQNPVLAALDIDVQALNAALAGVDEWLESLDIDFAEPLVVRPGGTTTLEIPINTVQDVRNLISRHGYVGFSVANGQTLLPFFNVVAYPEGTLIEGAHWVPIDFTKCSGFLPYSLGTFYDANGTEKTSTYNIRPRVPLGATIQVLNTSTQATSSHSFAPAGSPYVAGFSYAKPGGSYKTVTYSANGDVAGKSNFVGAFSFKKLVNDQLELQGQFAAPRRTGGLRIIELDAATTTPITPEDYEEFWWDEYGNDIGTIRFSLMEDDQETVVDYAFGMGLGTYDLSDNDIFRNTGATLAEAQAILDAALVPALQNLKLSSIELSAEGRPDLEPGDALQITDAAGQSFDVFLMRRELSGIQVLHDEITAVDGTEAGQGGQSYNSTGASGSVSPTDDWVVESGTTGIWTWQKWRSGIAECWGAKEVSIGSTTTWTSPISYFGTVVREAFPAGLFHSIESCVPAVSAVEGQTGADFWLSSATGYPKSTTYTQGVYLIRVGNVSNKKVMVEWEAKGRWKA